MDSSARWEWRTFGATFGPAEIRIRTYPSQRHHSAETYILSERSDINAKIRDDVLDLKALQQVDARGLELWLPIMKAGFPLPATAVDQAFRAWGLEPPAGGLAPRTPAEFLRDLIAPQASLAVVRAEKDRQSFAIDECIVEIADVTLDGTPLRTIAVEMTDPDRVWRTVNALGLATFDNVNYVKALKRFRRVPSTDVVT